MNLYCFLRQPTDTGRQEDLSEHLPREDIEDAEETEEGKEEESMLEAAERAEEPLEFI